MNEFSIHSYMSLLDTTGKWWAGGNSDMYQLVNFLINMGMVLNRWIYQTVDLSIQIFMSDTIFENTVGYVFKAAVGLYTSLFRSVGITMFIIALAGIFFIYVFKSPQEAFRKLAVLFLILGLNVTVYSNGETYLKDINRLFNEVEDVMNEAVRLPVFEGGNLTEQSVGNKDSVNSIREWYFNLTMRRSFSMVNFGTAAYEERFNQFLYREDQEYEQQVRDQLNENVRNASKENRWLTPDGSLDKWFISLYAWVSNLFTGIPLLLLASLKFLMKVLILSMLFGLPLVSLLSLLSRFSGSLITVFGRMLLLFFVGTFASTALFSLFFIMTLIDSSIFALAGYSIVSCVLGTVSKGVIVMLLLKYPGWILNSISIGYIRRNDSPNNKLVRTLRKRTVSKSEPIERKNTYETNQEIELAGDVSQSAVVDFRDFTTFEMNEVQAEQVKAYSFRNESGVAHLSSHTSISQHREQRAGKGAGEVTTDYRMESAETFHRNKESIRPETTKIGDQAFENIEKEWSAVAVPINDNPLANPQTKQSNLNWLSKQTEMSEQEKIQFYQKLEELRI